MIDKQDEFHRLMTFGPILWAVRPFGPGQQRSSVYMGRLARGPSSKSPVGNSHRCWRGHNDQASFLLYGATYRGLVFGLWTTSSKETGESGYARIGSYSDHHQ